MVNHPPLAKTTRTYLSRMNNMRSLAKSAKLDKQENPKSASVKKKTPER
jgi:hypothetical protein